MSVVRRRGTEKGGGEDKRGKGKEEEKRVSERVSEREKEERMRLLMRARGTKTRERGEVLGVSGLMDSEERKCGDD